VDAAGALAVAGGSLEADRGEHGRCPDRLAPLPPIGEEALLMLDADVPNGSLPATGGLDEEVVEIPPRDRR
jgi:hypothetical protein